MDGVRNKFYCRLKKLSIDIELKRDQLSDTAPIIVYRDYERLKLTINNISKIDHNVQLKVSGKNKNDFSMTMKDDKILPEIKNNTNVFNVYFKNLEKAKISLTK